MKAFLNDTKVKEKYLSRVHAHASADEIIKGRYWEDGKGCAVGCTIHSGDHNKYEKLLGLPRWLAYLEDSIFEGLPNGEAKGFPEQFLSAINVGADLTPVYHKFMMWLLVDPLRGVLRFADERGAVAIKRIAELHQLELGPTEGRPDYSAWAAAGAAAWAAAGAAAGDAARDAARISQRDELLRLLHETF
jgi:hypothetical protein